MQLEQPSARKRLDVGHILSFCVSEARFSARQNLCRGNNIKKPLCVVILLFESIVNQIVQLTTPIVPGPNSSTLCPFLVNIDCVAIPAQDLSSTLAFVWSFLRGPQFFQRSLFSASGISMLIAAIASAGDICARAAFDPWWVFLLILLPLWNAVETFFSSRSREFGLASVDSSAVDDHVCLTRVRISKLFEVWGHRVSTRRATWSVHSKKQLQHQ